MAAVSLDIMCIVNIFKYCSLVMSNLYTVYLYCNTINIIISFQCSLSLSISLSVCLLLFLLHTSSASFFSPSSAPLSFPFSLSFCFSYYISNYYIPHLTKITLLYFLYKEEHINIHVHLLSVLTFREFIGMFCPSLFLLFMTYGRIFNIYIFF